MEHVCCVSQSHCIPVVAMACDSALVKDENAVSICQVLLLVSHHEHCCTCFDYISLIIIVGIQSKANIVDHHAEAYPTEHVSNIQHRRRFDSSARSSASQNRDKYNGAIRAIAFC